MVRIYGEGNTHLTLSKKAEEAYRKNPQYMIQEVVVNDRHMYIVKAMDAPFITKPMTKKELNEWSENDDT